MIRQAHLAFRIIIIGSKYGHIDIVLTFLLYQRVPFVTPLHEKNPFAFEQAEV